MAKATTHPNHQLISSEDVEGTEVYGRDRSNIGQIDHLLIDKGSGRVAYAVMSFGGFLVVGHSHYPAPWGALTFDTTLGGFRTNITEQQLRMLPSSAMILGATGTGKYACTSTMAPRTTGSSDRGRDLGGWKDG